MKSCLFVLCIFLTSAAQAASTIVTESVGQAGEHIVTSREVQISSVIEKILDPPKGGASLPSGALFEIKSRDKKFSNEVTNLLLETVAHLEAQSFDMKLVSSDEIKRNVDKVEQAVRGKAYWESLEVSTTELRKMTERKVLAKSFIKFKTDSMTSIIADQEAQAYYERNRLNFGNLPFTSFRDSIKSYLSQQQLQDRMRSWFEVIKRKYKVRNFLVEGKVK